MLYAVVHEAEGSLLTAAIVERPSNSAPRRDAASVQRLTMLRRLSALDLFVRMGGPPQKSLTNS